MRRRSTIVMTAVSAACVLAVAIGVAATRDSGTTSDAGAFGGHARDSGVEHPFDYPELTQEDRLGDHAANTERLQVPDEVLDEMSSDDLVWTVLDFPYLVDFFASSQMGGGTEFLRGQCNALDELLFRDDAEEALRSVREVLVASDGEATAQWGSLKLEILDQIIATF